MSSDLEVLGIGPEYLLATIGGAVEHDDRVAPPNDLPANLDVRGCGPRHVRHRGSPTQHLLDRSGYQGRVLDELTALVRVVDEGERAERDQVASGLVTRNEE